MEKSVGTIMVLIAAVALLAVVACGRSSTAPVTTQPPVTETPVKGNPPPEEPKTIEVPAPIEDATVVAPEEPGGEYGLKITSGLPSGCAEFNGYGVERDGSRFVVDVTNLMPDPSEPIACTEIYSYHDGEVVLGSGLNGGETYTVAINGVLTITFVARSVDDIGMVEKESPIEEIEVTEADGGYVLTVISRLPLGSTCSKFNGYKINRRFAERIEVTLTHLEVTADNVPCTADLPAVTTEVPLLGDFVAGQKYTVSVNGTEATFPEEDLATVEVPAPIEDVTVVPPKAVNGEYILKVTSGLPGGCAKFNGYEVKRDGNGFVVHVTNLMLDPGEPIACTTIYGYHEEKITLGSDLVLGEAHTVTINGELTISFTALDAEGLAMVEKESPIDNVEVAEAVGGYMLTVVSRLPKGSSCSRFNGYEINRRFAERIEVTVTHMEVTADNVPCTRDLPVVVSEIPLGEDFTGGQTYTVSVNGEETVFTPR